MRILPGSLPLALGLMAILMIWPVYDAAGKRFTSSPAETGPLSMQICNPRSSFLLPHSIQSVMDGVVIVQNGDQIGSGVIISPNGYILTAAHLVRKHGSAAIYLNSGDTLPGQVIRMDSKRDIALIKVISHPLHCLKTRDTIPTTGGRMFTIGFLPEKSAGFIVEEGVIQRRRFIFSKGATYLQLSLDLKPGSSGGPLLTPQGEVAGIITWKVQNSNGSVSLFSLPAKTAIRTLNIHWQP